MPHVQPYGLEQEQLLSVIRGCEMDLEQTRYLDFPGLQRYCHLVAGVVGALDHPRAGETTSSGLAVISYR